MANRRRDPAKEQFWRQTVERQQASGVSVRVFCQREGLGEASFYMWRRELARRDRAQAQAPAQAPIESRLQEQRQGQRRRRRRRRLRAAFVPVRLAVPEQAAAIEIALAGGVVVRVRPGFDAQALRQVLATVGWAGPSAPPTAVAEGRSC